jgi:hypothetical protein
MYILEELTSLPGKHTRYYKSRDTFYQGQELGHFLSGAGARTLSIRGRSWDTFYQGLELGHFTRGRSWDIFYQGQELGHFL